MEKRRHAFMQHRLIHCWRCIHCNYPVTELDVHALGWEKIEKYVPTCPGPIAGDGGAGACPADIQSPPPRVVVPLNDDPKRCTCGYRLLASPLRPRFNYCSHCRRYYPK